MQPKAFSPDGYIVNQSLTGDVPYGLMTSDYNGCGWIAAYNFFKAIGRPQPPEQIAAVLSRGSAFKGFLGTGPLRLRRYLEANGCSIISATSHRRIFRLAPRAKAGILLYRSGFTLHYVTFVPAGKNKLRFFNAIAGEANHTTTMEEFIKTQAKQPWVYLMVTL